MPIVPAPAPEDMSPAIGPSAAAWGGRRRSARRLAPVVCDAAPLGVEYMSEALASPMTKLHRRNKHAAAALGRRQRYMTRLDGVSGILQGMLDDTDLAEDRCTGAFVPRPAASDAVNRVVADRTPRQEPRAAEPPPPAPPAALPVAAPNTSPDAPAAPPRERDLLREPVVATRRVARPKRAGIVAPLPDPPAGTAPRGGAPLPLGALGVGKFSRGAFTDRWAECGLLRLPESVLLQPRAAAAAPTRRRRWAKAAVGPTDGPPPADTRAGGGRRRDLHTLLDEQRALHRAAESADAAYNKLLERVDRWHAARAAAIDTQARQPVGALFPADAWHAACDYPGGGEAGGGASPPPTP